MSYDLIFLRREPGQSWEDARRAASETATSLPDAASWDRMLAGARKILGEVSVHVSDQSYELDHEQTGIQLLCNFDGASITVPYGQGEANAHTVRLIYRLGRAVEETTGLEGYDPQLGLPLSDALGNADEAAEMFDGVAAMFARHERTVARARERKRNVQSRPQRRWFGRRE